MERNSGSQQKGDSASQEQSRGSAASASRPGSQASGQAGEQSADRQRSIRTDREVGRSGDVASQQGGSTGLMSRYGTADNPISMIRRMAEDMDRLFESFGLVRPASAGAPSISAGTGGGGLWRGGSAIQQPAWVPQVETFRRGDQLVVRADLPGLDKGDVRVEVDDGVITISGERSEEHEENRDDLYRTERVYGRFFRAIPLPEGVNADAAEATFKDGVLEITLPAPREQGSGARQVQVR